MQSKNDHILSLASEIMDDIELSRNNPQAIVLKATRLARYVDNEEIRSFLKFEMQGYPNTDLAEKFMNLTGRWINKDEGLAYTFPLSQVEAKETVENSKLDLIRIPDTSAAKALIIIKELTKEISLTSNKVAKLSGIKSRVISIVHEFVTNVYYEKTFDHHAESIFDSYKKDIDLLLAEHSGDIIEQIPSLVSRLSEEDKESISQSLNTSRRIINAFANHIFPPTEDTINIGGKTIQLKEANVVNRINAYVYNNCDSKDRRKKIRQNLSNLYSRVSSGVHSDIDYKEAKSLFLNMYLILGEVLTLKNEK